VGFVAVSWLASAGPTSTSSWGSVARPVKKTIVHAFRAITGDSGINTGLLVSSAGFQDGAVQAAAYSSVRLLTWAQFQQLFAERWFRDTCVSSSLRRPTRFTSTPEQSTSGFAGRPKPCPPTPSGAVPRAPGRARAADRPAPRVLPGARRRRRWSVYRRSPGAAAAAPPRRPLTEQALAVLSADVLDAATLRPLLDALVDSVRAAAAKFDEVFGGRV